MELMTKLNIKVLIPSKSISKKNYMVSKNIDIGFDFSPETKLYYKKSNLMCVYSTIRVIQVYFFYFLFILVVCFSFSAVL